MTNRLRVGLVGTSKDAFNAEQANRDFRESATTLREFSVGRGFELHVVPQSLKNTQDAQRAVRLLQEKKIDLVLIQHNTVSSGDIAKVLGTMNVNFGIWAVPEHNMDGLPLASVCGMNMYAGIWTHFFKNRRVRFKWFFGSAGNRQFQDRLDLTIRALSAVKSLSCSRIGLVGDIAPGFYDVLFDERVLYSKWGVTVGRHEVSEVVSRAKKAPDSDVERTVDRVLPQEKCKNLSNEEREKTIRIYFALKQVVDEGNYDALAVRCWPEFQQKYEFAICASVSLLGEENILVACEGDAVGALSMLILHCLNDSGPTILTDLTTVDPQDDSMLMWHCGCAPSSWAAKGARRYCPHVLYKLGTVHDTVFSPQPTTVASLAEDGEQMLALTADIVDKTKSSYAGGRAWFNHLKMNGNSLSVLDFLETSMSSGFSHHFAITQGNVEAYLDELAFWKELKRIPMKRYAE